MNFHKSLPKGSIFFLLTSISTVGLILFLFRGWTNDGMQFDEAYRVNNIMPHIEPSAENYDQSIDRVTIFGADIPIAYKSYITSTFLIKYIPLMFFENPLLGLRLLELTYFIIPFLLFIFFSKKFVGTDSQRIINIKYINWIVFSMTLALATSPLFYPDARFRFAHSTFVGFLSIAVYFFCLHKSTQKNRYLFWGYFFLFLGVNFEVYFIWCIAAMHIALFLLYPKFVLKMLSTSRTCLAIAIGSCLGSINYILLNIRNGFPTIKPIYNKLFNIDKYAEAPIDGKPPQPLIEEIYAKLEFLYKIFGVQINIYLVVFAGIIISFFLFKPKENQVSKKVVVFSNLLPLLTLALTLISPNTTRQAHYTYFLPFFFFALFMNLYYLANFLPLNSSRFVRTFASIAVIGLGLSGSNAVIKKHLVTGGTHHFTPSIFDLHQYFEKNGTDGSKILCLQWGFDSQLYFLSKGHRKTSSLVFQLLSNPSRFNEYLISFIQNNSHIEEIYIPLYSSYQTPHEALIKNNLSKFVKATGGDINTPQHFYQRGTENIAITLYKLTNLDLVRHSIAKFTSQKLSRLDITAAPKSYTSENFNYSTTHGVHQTSLGQSPWAKKFSAYSLLNELSNQIEIDLWFPKLEHYTNHPITVEITINGVLITQTSIDTHGINNIKIEIPEKFLNEQILVLGLNSNSRYAPTNGDKRELAFVVSSIASF